MDFTRTSFGFHAAGKARPADLPANNCCNVLNGEVEFESSGGRQTVCEFLGPGDSIYFHTDQPHHISGVSKSPFAAHAAEAIAIFWSPLGDPDLVPAAKE